MSMPLAPAPQIGIPSMASPTLATPRAAVASLNPIPNPLISLVTETTASIKSAPRQSPIIFLGKTNQESSRAREREKSGGTSSSRHGSEGVVDERAMLDGRTTPTPESEAGNLSISTASIPSTAGRSSPTTSISTTSQPAPPSEPTYNSLHVPPAEVGLGPLAGEQQLKTSLQTKDRLFLLVLAKEMEAFIKSVLAGEAPNVVSAIPPATSSTSVLASMTASMTLAQNPSSSFQRMLVYKAAEWYGLKAVHAPEVSMVVGVLGDLDEKSQTLKLSELAPRAPSPPPKFRIIQRASANGESNGYSRSSSVAGDDASEAGSSKPRTLEEREAAYQKARQRIYGSSTDAEADLTPQEANSKPQITRQREANDFDDVPRRAYIPPNTAAPVYEPVYPSLFNPPNPEPLRPANPPTDPSFGYQQASMHYPMYGNQANGGMSGYPSNQVNGGYPIAPAPPTNGYGSVPQPYMDGNRSMYFGQPAAYNGQWRQDGSTTGYPPPLGPANQQMNAGQMPMMGQNWSYATNGNPMPSPHQPMPMIPQGLQYPQSYGYHPQMQMQAQSQMYTNLVQPTPLRPAPYPHSSASSSMSSRSYQDGSRPHSRGSTTSTRSAASSVRFGAMYPANQGGGYRQKGIKGQSIIMNGLTTLGLGMERKNTRGQSPSSATTASSRSSRRDGSISVSQPQPGQHQLPQRPDWAANNIQYHPSPIYPPGPHGGNLGPSTNDFPPLHRNGHAYSPAVTQGVYAEPMQVERAKMRPVASGGVWNGTASSARHNGSPVPNVRDSANIHQSQHPEQPVSPRSSQHPGTSRTPGPTRPNGGGAPVALTLFPDSARPLSTEPLSPDDPDFPRRQLKTSQTLFDHRERQETVTALSSASSMPPAPLAAVAVDVLGGSAEQAGSAAAPAPMSIPIVSAGMSPEEMIEARLAAVSLKEGVEIGPAPSRSSASGSVGVNGGGNAVGPAPSYAKIVRRD